jgi:hypothetical protein
MDLTAIIFNLVIIKIDILMEPRLDFNRLMITNQTLTFEPHIVTASILFGAWYLEMIFDLLLWPYVRPYRNRLREWIKRWVNFGLNRLIK